MKLSENYGLRQRVQKSLVTKLSRALIPRRHKEKILSAILENSADAIVSLDFERNVLSWNKAASLLFGYSEEEMLDKSIDCIIPQKLLEEGEMERMRAEINKKGFLQNYQTMRLAKNGDIIFVSISQSQLIDENGKVFGYSVIYRDVTDQKKSEQKLQEQFEKMQSAYKEMGRQRRYLDYIEEAMDIAHGKHSPADFTYFVNALMIISQADAVTLRTFDKKKQSLKLEACSGVSNDWWSKKYINPKGTIFETVMNEKKPLKIADIWSEPKYQSPGLARKNNLKSALMIPLVHQNEFLGTVSIYIRPETPITLLSNDFIGIFAKAVAAAISLHRCKK